MNDNLINYLVDKSKGDKSIWIDLIRYNLGSSIYGEGEQFKKKKNIKFF